MNNLGNVEDMQKAIWATLYHCASTDAKPHHTRCPAGTESWCFFRKAQAQGKRPPLHANHNATAISQQVFKELIPIYRRVASPELMGKIMHGKTQNSNESLNNVIWTLCPKEVFCGKQRVTAAVAEAVDKFNRGGFQFAEVLKRLDLSLNVVTSTALTKRDSLRIKKAEKSAEAASRLRRRERYVERRQELAQQEDIEGGTYAPGLLADAV